MLHGLASDLSVTVRAAVAMNVATPAHVDALLASDRDERVRALLARKLAVLVPGLSAPDRGTLQQRALDMLTTLAKDAAIRVRAAIADVVHDMPAAPRDLILLLARDAAISVFEPVLRLSPLLTAEDLLALITDPPNPATVTAIARRPYLGADVSDAIAHGADGDAITALLANQSAAIHETTLDALITRAEANLAWHAPLVQRPNLPPRAARALSGLIAGDLLRQFAQRADLPADVLRDIGARLERTWEGTAVPTRQEPDQSDDQIMDAARRLAGSGRLTEDTVLAAVRRGETRLIAALLAVAADVPLAVMDRACSLRSAKGLVSLAWKAGFSMRVAGPLQGALGRLPPGTIMPPGPGETFPLAVEEMRWQIEFLARTER